MKFARVVIVIALAASLVGNYMLWRRSNSMRAHVRVGNKTFSKREYYNRLEQRLGRDMTAEIVQYELVTQAAKKAGIDVDKKEIDDKFQETLDANPKLANQYFTHPWLVEDKKRQMATAFALQALQVKDVPVTDDQLRDHFNQNPGKWDRPDRVYFKAMLAGSAENAHRAEEMMRNISDPRILADQLKGQASFISLPSGTLLVERKPGGKFPDPKTEAAASMRPGQVTTIHQGNAQAYLIVKMDRVEMGKKMTFEEVKDKVARDFKASRGVPPTEVLQKLWDQTTVETDDPGLKQQIQGLLFPERAAAAREVAAAVR